MSPDRVRIWNECRDEESSCHSRRPGGGRPRVVTEDGRTRRVHDPYAFPPQAPAQELYLFNQGSHYQAYRLLGSHREIRHGVAGVRFRARVERRRRA